MKTMRNILVMAAFLTAGIGNLASALILDENRGQAILDDGRLQKFVTVIELNYNVSCPLPKADAIDAQVACGDGGDMSSCYYDFTIPCAGDPGLRGLKVNVEFATPRPTPLNLTISTSFLR